ncbi:putative metal chaperone, involved in Zn homeostasis, GTPase [Candidatus Burkholderia verschuerenii]|uniref:Putative metal chaperone, involved in Zn homeostasis, GTPase n=1 Tax=Candidatus Burkholderia verschuerenii TaxID=242163 RepID=A0A0L0MBF9_9BURK|nr:GTP-binding protein [Candidatus Burkholderia verschuerenii]KND59596.1 putative metal chaperone, involved in Zn homeostasis, GTPase [Candidatus Burkholderia verschuerenii]
MTGTMSSRIPVTLLTGFLGSGKTTILNHLVQQSELADALVIINEFAAIPLDHQLVAHSTDNVVMEMNSGCLCCTIRGDLITTLRDIHWRFSRGGQRQFDRVLIETTGLADPAPIIHTLMTQAEVATRYRLDGIVTALDLATGSGMLDVHPEAIRQVAMADVLLLTKGDLITPRQRSALERRLDSINPAAPRLDVPNGVVAPDGLLNLGFFSTDGKTPDVKRWLREEAYADTHTAGVEHDGHDHSEDHSGLHHGHDTHDVNRHDDHIRAFCFSLNEPIPEVVLAAWLETLLRFAGSNILRVKGILNVEGHDRPYVIQGVQHIFHPPMSLPAWPDDDHRSRVIFITRDVNRQAIEETFDAFRQAVPQAWVAES